MTLNEVFALQQQDMIDTDIAQRAMVVPVLYEFMTRYDK